MRKSSPRPTGASSSPRQRCDAFLAALLASGLRDPADVWLRLAIAIASKDLTAARVPAVVQAVGAHTPRGPRAGVAAGQVATYAAILLGVPVATWTTWIAGPRALGCAWDHLVQDWASAWTTLTPVEWTPARLAQAGHLLRATAPEVPAPFATRLAREWADGTGDLADDLADTMPADALQNLCLRATPSAAPSPTVARTQAAARAASRTRAGVRRAALATNAPSPAPLAGALVAPITTPLTARADIRRLERVQWHKRSGPDRVAVARRCDYAAKPQLSLDTLVTRLIVGDRWTVPILRALVVAQHTPAACARVLGALLAVSSYRDVAEADDDDDTTWDPTRMGVLIERDPVVLDRVAHWLLTDDQAIRERALIRLIVQAWQMVPMARWTAVAARVLDGDEATAHAAMAAAVRGWWASTHDAPVVPPAALVQACLASRQPSFRRWALTDLVPAMPVAAPAAPPTPAMPAMPAVDGAPGALPRPVRASARGARPR